jgi:hypothetical protein
MALPELFTALLAKTNLFRLSGTDTSAEPAIDNRPRQHPVRIVKHCDDMKGLRITYVKNSRNTSGTIVYAWDLPSGQGCWLLVQTAGYLKPILVHSDDVIRIATPYVVFEAVTA